MACDVTRFITNAGGFVRPNISPQMRKAIGIAIKGISGGGWTAPPSKQNVTDALTSAIAAFKGASDEQVAAARINTWLEVVNANLGSAISTNVNTLVSYANYLSQLDPRSLEMLDVYSECTLIGGKLNG